MFHNLQFRIRIGINYPRLRDDRYLEGDLLIRRPARNGKGILAVIAFVVAILAAANEDNSGLAIISIGACGGFLCLWFWFYLLAQIIHIRANTAKD